MGDVIQFLSGEHELEVPNSDHSSNSPSKFEVTLDDVIGQPLAKRALLIALAGGHHLLFVGPPGVGKSLLASCAPSLLPPMDPNAWVEIAKNYAHCPEQLPSEGLRPFRSPHHSI